MSLEIKITAELKEAMIAKNKDRIDALRSLRSAILEFQKSGTGKEFDESEEMKLLLNAAKKRKDAIEMYENANREELAEKEKNELAVIEEFLPNQLSKEEIREIVKSKISETGASGPADMGKIIGPLMKQYSGQIDGKLTQSIIKEMLS